MYPNTTLPRAPSSVVTDRLDARAQSPMGAVSANGALLLNNDVMMRIIRIVAVSGSRTDLCFLAGAHPYFFRQTDELRVQAYLHDQVRLIGECASSAELLELLQSMLDAMHAAGERLPMDARLFFLIELADSVMVRGREGKEMAPRILGALDRAGKSLKLDAPSRMALLLFLMTGHAEALAPDKARRRVWTHPQCSVALLQRGDALPPAEQDALTMFASVMTKDLPDDEQGVFSFTEDVLSRMAGWPDCWKAGMLHCLFLSVHAHGKTTQLAVAAKLFDAMCQLPAAHRGGFLNRLIQFIGDTPRLAPSTDFNVRLLKHLPGWLAACNTLSCPELPDLIAVASHAVIAISWKDGAGSQEDDPTALANALIALGLANPPDARSAMALGLLALAVPLMDAAERLGTFKQLWHEAVRCVGLFDCVHHALFIVLPRCRSAPGIADFLLAQFACLPEVERNIVALPVCLTSQERRLAPGVAAAILAHLPAVSADLRAGVMSNLLEVLQPGGDRAPFYSGPAWHVTQMQSWPQSCIDAFHAPVLLPENWLSSASPQDSKMVFGKMVASFPTLGSHALGVVLRHADWAIDSAVRSGTDTCEMVDYLLEFAATLPLSLQKTIALRVLARALPLMNNQLTRKLIAGSLVERSFQVLRQLPAALRTNALCALCLSLPPFDRNGNSLSSLFDFVYEESARLPERQQARVLHALATREGRRHAAGLHNLGRIRVRAALLGPDSGGPLLIQIERLTIEAENMNVLIADSPSSRLENRLAALAIELEELRGAFSEQ